MSIRKDMRLGDIAEQRVIKLLSDLGLTVAKNEDKETRSHYDIHVQNIMACGCCVDYEFTIEVKNDVYAIRSGNIAIEMYNPKSGKESGLTATKSDLWVFMVGDELWAANTKELTEYVEKNKPFRIIDNAGDGNALVYLYKKDVLFPAIFHQIDNLAGRELVKKLESIVL